MVAWLRSLIRSPDRFSDMFDERPGRTMPYGLLKLLGAIPYNSLFRFSRFARLWRAGWHLADLSPRAMARDIAASRAESAVYITTTIALLVLLFGSIFVLIFELEEPTATIDTSSDALWWAFVTITTVGYGDEVPVTEGGRIVAVLTMVVGIAIFGVIAGSLSRLLAQGARSTRGSDRSDSDMGAVAQELAALRAEVAELRRTLESGPG